MQPMDPADNRQPNVKVAASIRAAILDGELEPGQRLPSGPELARFFGVAGMTVQKAIRALVDEGFVRTKGGSGVYVRDQASTSSPEEAGHPLTGTADFLYEMGHLKRVNRAGWLLLGIPLPESVAEHSFRVGVTGIVLATMEGADVGRVAALCIMHDSHETRIGDVPSVGRAYITSAAPEAVSAHQTAAMPGDTAKVLQDLKAEYEAAETLEAKVAKDADKLETLLQAMEYQAQGHNTVPWQETSIGALRTDSGKQLAEAITSGDPHHWWSAFAASYHELRAGSLDRTRGLERRERQAEDPRESLCRRSTRTPPRAASRGTGSGWTLAVTRSPAGACRRRRPSRRRRTPRPPSAGSSPSSPTGSTSAGPA